MGNNPAVTELLRRRANEVAPDVDPAQTSLLIVAHGTDLNENSAVAAKREAQKIRARAEYAAVLNVYMEEQPLVADWKRLTKTRNVVVVPFFIADGLHSYQDIPTLLGIQRSNAKPSPPKSNRALSHLGGRQTELFESNPHLIDDRLLFYAGSIGTDRRFADIIVQQAFSFDEANQLQSFS